MDQLLMTILMPMRFNSSNFVLFFFIFISFPVKLHYSNLRKAFVRNRA